LKYLPKNITPEKLFSDFSKEEVEKFLNNKRKKVSENNNIDGIQRFSEWLQDNQ
jgi:hypothetical protein